MSKISSDSADVHSLLAKLEKWGKTLPDGQRRLLTKIIRNASQISKEEANSVRGGKTDVAGSTSAVGKC